MARARGDDVIQIGLGLGPYLYNIIPLALAIRRAACVASHTAHAEACLSVVQACLSVVQACLSVVQACLSIHVNIGITYEGCLFSQRHAYIYKKYRHPGSHIHVNMGIRVSRVVD